MEKRKYSFIQYLAEKYSKPSPKKGLVAYFDILGYQQIIDNNKIEETADIVNQIISFRNIPEICNSTIDEFDTNLLLDKSKSVGLGTEKIRTLLFSDTIIMSLSIEDDFEPAVLMDQAVMFFLACKLLLSITFEQGFPMRGAISYGDYYINDYCFAGKPIIDTYKLANNLDYVGCAVVENEKWKYFMGRFSEGQKDILLKRFVNYSVPIKNSKENEIRLALKWRFFTPAEQNINSYPSIRDTVLSSFLKHNKMIDGSVIPKVNNTEIFLQHLKQLHEKE